MEVESESSSEEEVAVRKVSTKKNEIEDQPEKKLKTEDET
jgi:hypothetical protein